MSEVGWPRTGSQQSKPEEWPRWIRRFERLREASDLESKSAAIQVSTLVYSMGDKAEDLLHSFALSEADAKKYDTIKGKFQDFLVKRGNTTYERDEILMIANKKERLWTSLSRTYIV